MTSLIVKIAKTKKPTEKCIFPLSYALCVFSLPSIIHNCVTLSLLRAFQFKDSARSRAHLILEALKRTIKELRGCVLYTWRILSTGPELNVASWKKSSPSGEDRRCLLKIVVACWRTPPTGEDRHCLVKIAAAWWRSRRRCRHLNQTELLPVCARSQNLSIKRFSTAHLLFSDKSVGSRK